MNIALVDDEALQLNTLKSMLMSALKHLGMDADMECHLSPQAFLAEFETGKYDIVILDIYMDGMLGIDVARSIREKDENVVLAFCTSSNDFASQSYEVNARYYLQKPITEDKIVKMLHRFQLSQIEHNRTVRLPDGFRLPLHSIVFTEYLNHSVKIHIKGQSPHTVRANQSEIEVLLLSHKGFYVINKGCIVSFAQVLSMEANAFRMQNGETVPIARRRFKELEAAYTQYIFDKMVEEVGN